MKALIVWLVLSLFSGCTQQTNQSGGLISGQAQSPEMQSEFVQESHNSVSSDTSVKTKIAENMLLDEFTVVNTDSLRNPNGEMRYTEVMSSLCDENYLYFKKQEDSPFSTLLYRIDKRTGENSLVANANYTGESDVQSRGAMLFGNIAYEALSNVHGVNYPHPNAQSDIMEYNLLTTTAYISFYYRNFTSLTADKLDEKSYVTLGYGTTYENDIGQSEYTYYLTRHDVGDKATELRTYSLEWSWSNSSNIIDMRTDKGKIYVLHPIHKAVEYQISIYDGDGSTLEIIPADELYSLGHTRRFEVRNNCFVIDNSETMKVFTLENGIFTNLSLPAEENQISLLGIWKDYLVFQSVRSVAHNLYVLDTITRQWTTIPITGSEKYPDGFFYLTGNGGVVAICYSLADEREYYLYNDTLFQ